MEREQRRKRRNDIVCVTKEPCTCIYCERLCVLYRGGIAYESNYCAGLRVLDVSGIKTGDVNEVRCE